MSDIRYRRAVVGVGVTINIGNFENVKTNIELEGDIYEEEEIVDDRGLTPEELIDKVYDKVEDKLVEKAKETVAQLTGKAKRDTNVRPE